MRWLLRRPVAAFACLSGDTARHVLLLQKFRNEDGMLARWYLLLGQFSVTFEYRPGAQHANADGMSRQCDQCWRPDCPVSSSASQVADLDASSVHLDQPFASSEMGDSMDADLLPELLGETWWHPHCWRDSQRTCPRWARTLNRVWHPVRMRLSLLCGSGYSLGWFQLGWIVPDFPRGYVVGDCRLATCLWIQTENYNVIGLLRREFLSLLCQAGSIRR